MIKRLLGAFKRTLASSVPANQPAPFSEIYELLFCDRPELFKPQAPSTGVAWQRALYSAPNTVAIQAIAEDPNQESRVRLLAFRWLASHERTVDSKEILGVVIEVGLEQGNDTLAAYADGSVRYINQSGKLAVFEGGPPEVVAAARELVQASRDTVDRIGPWDQPRRAPPARGDIRLTFLVSDGLYFGEGPFSLLANEPLAKPVINTGVRLLQLCVEAASAKA